MGDQNDAITGVATAMISTSRVSRKDAIESAVALAALALLTSDFDLEEFGWLCREIMTAFPVWRYKIKSEIRKGWRRHKMYNEHL